MIDLSGRVALVTGSSRGIGRATAIRLAEAGADIVINYVTSRAAAIEVAQKITGLGRQVWVVKADVSESEDVEALMDFIKSNVGRLDIVVSNAATGGFRSLLNSGAQHFNTAMQTNVMSLVHLVREAKEMLTAGPHRGKVVAISSHGADIALPMYGLIGGSKAALESIARHLALELGDAGVNVNIVKAGLVETDSTRRLPGAAAMFDGRKGKSMMGERMLCDRDVADAVLFLASPLSDLVQGETLTVDGGSAVHV
ncbi:SDR family oxidoreductase [Allorhodopirellula heiligendammensis]|uniref:Enoyl-[acyl-carrier-protein] reductase [NADPH] FabL n=1 Tax=Allorhodopirellula heiligendammensis TaxID=2714739 RepID=A0A5C6C3K3_9BACT|nr:SDR family oxidoreductase [Allorhodopirellula heiligendammensis]TWU18665.1 Enoyl-[acyl-carrier-protein] reductase [NADPH] FabL [Allorhodopirellula heiligendammensis]|tara:strand:- start:1274 stop:2038 length:765 start_codon:yes stop_codon:yes gene_type:complete